MQRSKVEVFVHLVWTTRRRELLVTSDVERALFGCIRAEVERLKCEALAVNGMPDHVHLVARLHSTTAISKLAQGVKGVSSQMANDQLGFNGAFDWQDHYGAFSISRPHLQRVIAYVDRQKERHASGELWPHWEQAFEEAGPQSPVREDG